MKKLHKISIGLAGTAAAVGAGWLSFSPGAASKRAVAPVGKPSPLARADAAYAARPERARSEYRAFVSGNAASGDPEVQDRVGAARMRLGYLAAKGKDFAAARRTFLVAAKVEGSGARGEFGTVGDQAAYQAVVCLVAEGKKAEARKGFEAYLRERPLSSLARAAHRRLALLNGGATKPAWDALLQTAVARQEASIRFEASVCGPKCLQRILPGGPGYKALAKLCGTRDSGTTVEGMRKGLKSLGVPSWAVRLSRADLAKARLPAVLLEGDHYVVIERIEGDAARVWDPRFKRVRDIGLPPLDDPDFSLNLIVLSRPEGL